MQASQSGSQFAAKPAEDDAGVDRLSMLPDDVLTRILVRLAPACRSHQHAGRTSVLSRRWRRLWLLLPELRFPLCSDPRLAAAALAAHDAALSYLSVWTLDADAESVAAWLPTVARRLTGHLSFTNREPGRDINDDDDGDDAERGFFELPCLANAISVTLDLTVPPAGVFARLTDISLTRVLFRGPCALGDAVSSAQCPCLLAPQAHGPRRPGPGQPHDQFRFSPGMTLDKVRGLERLAVASPALEYLSVVACFIFIGISRSPTSQRLS